MKQPIFIDYPQLSQYSTEEMVNISSEFYQNLNTRRTIRDFSDKPIDLKIIENCIRAAGTAPSGANRQPWHFSVISDFDIKHQIRVAAEKEEHEFYNNRAPQEWLKALSPFGTDEHKEFLDTAPVLISIFVKKYDIDSKGNHIKNYYPIESVGIATGVLITAIHQSGLATLTHTPSPMIFLNEILRRPENEKPFLLLVVGYPAKNAQVPDIKRKNLNEIMSKL